MRSLLLSIFLFVLSSDESECLCTKEIALNIRKAYHYKGSFSTTTLTMTMPNDMVDVVKNELTNLSSLLGSLSNSLGSFDNSLPSLQTILETPEVGSIILDDISRIGLDFVPFLPDRSEISGLVIFFSRISSFLSDYIPDHEIQSEELFFRVYLLFFSSGLFFQIIFPTVGALKNPLSFKELRLYTKIFEPVGIPILKYRLLVSKCFEWKEVSPHSKLCLENKVDTFYMLYSGNINIITEPVQDLNDERYTNGSMNEYMSIIAFDFFDEFSSGQRILSSSKYNKKGISSNTYGQSQGIEESDNISRVITGACGACLLKIDTNELLELMSVDDKLSKSIKNVMFIKTREKVTRVLEDQKK